MNKDTLSNINYVCIGIDLGTTYTLMATVDSRDINFSETIKIPVKFVSIPQKSPDKYVPDIHDEKVASILAITPDKKYYVGNNLYYLKGRDGFEYKKNMFYHWKVEMGVERFPMYPDAISEKVNMPYKIAGRILNYCRANFLKRKDEVLENTIVTVPASFQANQRQDVLKACEFGKIKSSPTMLIDEPSAAFIGYFNRLEDSEKQSWANNVRNKNVLVVDFGGGTLDLSILNVDFRKDTGIIIANRAISRYNDLGGQDIDSVIAEEYLFPLLKREYPEVEDIGHYDLQNTLIPQLAVYGEKLKIAICENLSLKVADKDVEEIDYASVNATVEDCVLVYKGETYDMGELSINGKQYKELFLKVFRGKYYNFRLQDKSVTTASHSISEIIEKSNLTLDAINYVLFIGGSSFNPFLVSLVKDKLKKAIALQSSEPDKLVAEGAAVFSYFYYVHKVSLIKPITSDTIGITIKGNRFQPIIEQGTQLPAGPFSLPEFKLQSNMNNEIVVPVCINDVDFPIGEIREKLNRFHDTDGFVTIKANITADKIFDLKVYIDGEYICDASFDNPFSIGKVAENELKVTKAQKELARAKSKADAREEKEALRRLIPLHADVDNNAGVVETAEEYIRRFDDQDSWAWNMLYIGNSHMGKTKAARTALERAIELDPESPVFIYNYSLVIASMEGSAKALSYLQNQPESTKQDESVRCKIVLLKDDCNIECKNEALAIIEDYKSNPDYFNQFVKRVLLPGVFKIAGEKYSYVEPDRSRNDDDEIKYLDRRTELKSIQE
ncbi:MAG: Hsp70 family protein [Bacteroidales bacterium]